MSVAVLRLASGGWFYLPEEPALVGFVCSDNPIIGKNNHKISLLSD
ncbi:hypothetical protein [Rhizobium tropici]|nr:hypothetical protein [Rhizobium tropici]